MLHPRLLSAVGALALSLTALASCDEVARDPAGTPPAGATVEEAAETLTLALASAPAADLVTVDLAYARRADQAAPRMMELWLGYDGLAFVGAEAGDALERAGKRLVAQERDGALRLVVYAADNVTVVESGAVARLSFRRLGGDASVTLEPRDPFFAPSEANANVLLGPALRIPAEVTR